MSKRLEIGNHRLVVFPAFLEFRGRSRKNLGEVLTESAPQFLNPMSSEFQIDVYKRQISELHSKLEAENNRADKSDFETKRLLEKAEALSVERDRLQAERDTLKETNAELHDQVHFFTFCIGLIIA